MFVKEVLAKGSALLASAQNNTAKIETPFLDAALLLAEVLHTDRAGLVVREKEIVSMENCDLFQNLLKRRMEGECIAYLLGRKEFYGLEFLVNPAVLVPRPETETLVEAAINACKNLKNTSPKKIRILDLCTGSGAAAIAFKHEIQDSEVWASDISAEALETAKRNSKKLLGNLSGDFEPVHFIQSDLFNELFNHIENNSLDLIMANPPYITADEISSLPPEVRHEPKLALDGGKDGMDLIRKIISGAKSFLCPGGLLLLEADPRQIPVIRLDFEDNSYENICIYRDLSDERVISAVNDSARK